jgi:hypothetical protein
MSNSWRFALRRALSRSRIKAASQGTRNQRQTGEAEKRKTWTPVPCLASPCRNGLYPQGTQASQAAFHPPYLFSLKQIRTLDNYIESRPILIYSSTPRSQGSFACREPSLLLHALLSCVAFAHLSIHHPSIFPPFGRQRSPCHVPGNPDTLSPWDLADKSTLDHTHTHTHTHTRMCAAHTTQVHNSRAGRTEKSHKTVQGQADRPTGTLWNRTPLGRQPTTYIPSYE